MLCSLIQSAVRFTTCLSLTLLLTLALPDPLPAQKPSAEANQTADEDSQRQADFSVRMGKRYVNMLCSRCHGRDGKGGRGPDLTDGVFRHAKSDEDLLKIIQNGISGTDMPGGGNEFVHEDLQIIAYLRAAALERQAAEKPPAGNADKGYELFKQNQCQSCHWVGSGGGRIGTDLTRLTATPSYVRASMSDPNSQIDVGYQLVNILLEDDSVVSGRRLHENTYYILLMDSQEVLHAIDKQRIEKITRPHQSLMPSFKEKLSKEDIEDITTFLLAPKRIDQ